MISEIDRLVFHRSISIVEAGSPLHFGTLGTEVLDYKRSVHADHSTVITEVLDYFVWSLVHKISEMFW